MRQYFQQIDIYMCCALEIESQAKWYPRLTFKWACTTSWSWHACHLRTTSKFWKLCCSKLRHIENDIAMPFSFECVYFRYKCVLQCQREAYFMLEIHCLTVAFWTRRPWAWRLSAGERRDLGLGHAKSQFSHSHASALTAFVQSLLIVIRCCCTGICTSPHYVLLELARWELVSSI